MGVHCLLECASSVVNRAVSPKMWSRKSHQPAQHCKESSIKVLLSWQRCPVWSVLIKGSWVVKWSQLSHSPPPHCLNALNSSSTCFEPAFWKSSIQSFLIFPFIFPRLHLATVEFRSSMDSGVCTQEPSMKSTLALSTKKSVTYPGDFQDNPAKPPLYHKQPPALPPKPFSRIPNHSAGQWHHLVSSQLFIHCFSSVNHTVTPCFRLKRFYLLVLTG